MCQSQAEGGRRCASHTRPLFMSALENMKDSERITQVTIAQFIDAAVAHASTPSGIVEVLHEANQSRPALARLLQQVADKGREIQVQQGTMKPRPIPRPTAPLTSAQTRVPAGTKTPGGWTLTRHVLDQAYEKHFAIQDIIDTIDNPADVNENLLHPGQQRHMKDKICVVVDPATKSAITCFANWVATAPRADQTDAAALEYRRKYEAGLDRNGRERSA